MDNNAFISAEFLFSIFIILIIATGLLLYSSTTFNSTLNVESNFNHRLILDSVASEINQVDSQGNGYSKYIKLPDAASDYVIKLEDNKLTIEYENKKGETLLPFIDAYSSYKLYEGNIYLIEKTSDGKILIK